MTDELKTLKDMSAEEWKDRKDFVELWVKVDELKHEAIKEIKVLKNLGKSNEDLLWENITGKKIVYSKTSVKTVIKYIKWKFNITKEDLK